MFSSEVVKMLYTGFWETIYMTLVSTALGYVIGLPLGVTLAVTGKGGIRENKVVYRILDVISNVIRSIPFLILLILIIPLTRFLVGKSYGSSADVSCQRGIKLFYRISGIHRVYADGGDHQCISGNTATGRHTFKVSGDL